MFLLRFADKAEVAVSGDMRQFLKDKYLNSSVTKRRLRSNLNVQFFPSLNGRYYSWPARPISAVGNIELVTVTRGHLLNSILHYNMLLLIIFANLRSGSLLQSCEHLDGSPR